MIALFSNEALGAPPQFFTIDISKARFATAWQRIGGIVAPMILGAFLSAKLPLFSSFAFLGAIMIANSILVLGLLYETKGKSLEQIAAAITSKA